MFGCRSPSNVVVSLFCYTTNCTSLFAMEWNLMERWKFFAIANPQLPSKKYVFQALHQKLKTKQNKKKLNKIYIMIATNSKRFPFKMKFQIKCYNYIYGQVLFTVLVWLRAIILLKSCAKRNVLKSRKIRK